MRVAFILALECNKSFNYEMYTRKSSSVCKCKVAGRIIPNRRPEKKKKHPEKKREVALPYMSRYIRGRSHGNSYIYTHYALANHIHSGGSVQAKDIHARTQRQARYKSICSVGKKKNGRHRRILG